MCSSNQPINEIVFLCSSSCSCPAGFDGQYCEVARVWCAGGVNPCKNGAACSRSGSTYTCVCPAGWQGRNCSRNIDDCAGHECQVPPHS